MPGQDQKTETLHADAAGLDRGAALLRAGALVAFPTETVYGLGADATNDQAVAAIYAAKGRPSFNPLIVHLPGTEAAARYGVLGPNARKLAAAFWPGPLTLVLTRNPDCAVSKLVSAGLPSLAIRVPELPLAQDLLRAAAVPVAAPSANRSGRISPTRAAHVLDGLDGRIAAVMDGAECAVGLESTILDLTDDAPRLLRPGGISVEQIEAVIGARLATGDTQAKAPIAPGLLASHYAPGARVVLNQSARPEGALWLGFGRDCTGAEINLSARGDMVEAAANLFEALHRLDDMAQDGQIIAVAPIPNTGLGLAINDRLTRAAAPRG